MPAEQNDTVVGMNVELKGSLHNRGAIQVYGKINGDIYSDGLVVIGETAVITGPIVAKQVDVSGQVNGSINAEELLELQPKSVVKGDIVTGRLSIKPGAVFIGKSQMGVETKSVKDDSDQEDQKSKDLDEDSLILPAEQKKKPRLEIE